MAKPQLTCLFCTSVTAPRLLGSPAGRDLGGDLLVDCGLAPTFASVLGLDLLPGFPGVAGLLGSRTFGELVRTSPRLPVPILPAATQPSAAAPVRSALQLLPQSDAGYARMTLLVPLADVRALGAALAVAHRFAIAWDISEPPQAELADFARWLAEENLADRTTFAGLFPYAGRAIEDAHRQRLEPALAPLAQVGRSPLNVITVGG
jgi:hypothetical protein